MLQYHPQWDEALRAYPDNQAYLDAFTEDQVTKAIQDKVGAGGPIGVFANVAINDPHQTVEIEQGPHQPEDAPGGGFTLHVTPRWYNGRGQDSALHLYLRQDNSGNLIITRMTGRFPPNPRRRYNIRYRR